MTRKRFRNIVPVLLVAALTGGLTTLGAPSASAGLLVESAPSCANQPLEQPFQRFGDSAYYTLLPGGTFEAGAPGWSLYKAATVPGNESFFAHSRSDSRSLSLSSGGQAKSPTICVGLQHPTMRFFARSSGLLPLLSVEVIASTSLGLKVPVPLGVVAPGSSWHPTARYIVVANLLPLLPNNYTPVSFRFHAVRGSWWIDDVYVDPKKH